MTPVDIRGRLDRVADDIRTAVLRSADRTHPQLTARLVEAVLAAMSPDPPGAPGPDRTPPDLDALGRAYAQHDVPLAVALGELHLTVVTVSHRWWEVATPADVAAMYALGQIWDGRVGACERSLTDGYAAALAGRGSVDVARRQLAEEILLGRLPTQAMVQAASVRVFEHYAVLVGAPRSSATEQELGQALTGPLGSTELLVVAHRGRCIVLVPAPPVAAADEERAAAELFAAVSGVLNLSRAAVALVPRTEVPAAVARSLPVLEQAARGAAAGVLLVSTRPDPVVRVPEQRERLLLELVDWPVLVDTLRELYRQGGDVARTATAMRTTRNVLLRRLERILDLTGHDPLSATGRRRFLTELTTGAGHTGAPVSPRRVRGAAVPDDRTMITT